MSILITGSSGFIGKHLRTHPSVMVHVTRGQSDFKREGLFNYIINELSGSTQWDSAFKGVDAVIHLAGIAHSRKCGLADLNTINVDATLQLANSAVKSGVKRFVFVSSIGVNGGGSQLEPFSPSSPPNPHSDYAKSKFACEIGLNEIAKQTGLEVVIVRPTLVYGPNAPGNFGMLTKLVNSIPFLPFGLANNRRDFISVGNLVDLLIVCAKHKNAPGNIFLASENNTVSTRDFVNAIAAGQGRKVFQIPIPVSFMRLVGLVIGKSAMIEQLFGNLEVDSSNLKDILNWTPPYSMKESMAMLRK
ncbi:NAD-dependent epimerase/dehydratase family protein [Vibrio sp. MM46]|uniref:NAD-dependent epimerase/dehydratase family protein n=1 Tax=Vibrio TaxID=662 RepID=UPI00066CD120|nr:MULTISPECIES: NAD-dependent epimerase/dehydratase family protein [Vibrio]EKO3799010.1 NAD-dependent epimerase/dehydratase family protein [Vibrio harveyi]MDA0123029.1 NAD-dependent epimerase/dehydratase family protein [Vibrio sp. MM46]